ncbi:G2/M mitosis-specific cyclin B, copy C-like protein [Daphnia pulex]|uniref:G2/M mitosis-specific cyclin B, copy C-like protein n=1 Tax=Daphnia pulex TaxID=6669 RepID=E9GWY4_DAPPU|nr:G2/M mitosis-specific cyclin B, copy C-like protein [Daphnia pulex]|eukprot:EFX76033.1 G2/M mitosis-specific cyclin B, copy C-like protein [Daphnia pulex]
MSFTNRRRFYQIISQAIEIVEHHVSDTKKEAVKPAVELLAVYFKDVYKYLNELEEKTVVKSNYMEIGYKIKPHMCTILIDWMLDNLLLPRIIFFKLRLLLCDMIYSLATPEIHDFVFISDKAFTKKEILRMELRILKAMDFSFGCPFPLHFLRRYTKAANTHVYDWVDVLHHTFVEAFHEIIAARIRFLPLLPSQLAAAVSLCLSLKIVDERETPIDVLWNDTL